MSNSVDPDRSSLILVYTFCQDMYVRKLKIIMVAIILQQHFYYILGVYFGLLMYRDFPTMRGYLLSSS